MRSLLLALALTPCVAGCRRAPPPAEPAPATPPAAFEVAPVPVEPESPPEPVLRAGQAGSFAFVRIDGPALEADHREIPLRVTAPVSDAPAPVFVFSHGANGSSRAYEPLAEHWASHGYVVIQPTHGDSLSLAEPGEIRRSGSLRERTRSAAVMGHWRTRPLDIRTVLDRLADIEAALRAEHPGAAPFDATKIAVGGHSFGAHTTLMVAGMELTAARRSAVIDDPRPLAFVAISPQGRGRSLRDTAWKRITRPTLFISGTEDVSPVTGEAAETRRDPFDLCPPGDKLLAWIEGAHHGFGGISGAARYPGAGPRDARQVTLIRSLTTSFLDAHVRGDEAALAYVRGQDAAAASEIPVTLSRR